MKRLEIGALVTVFAFVDDLARTVFGATGCWRWE